jgi:hypothetical protein
MYYENNDYKNLEKHVRNGYCGIENCNNSLDK